MAKILCPSCSGRGFNIGVASNYGIDHARKNVCEDCSGTGQIWQLNCLSIFGLGLLAIGVALLLSFYIIYPLIAAWLDNVR